MESRPIDLPVNLADIGEDALIHRITEGLPLGVNVIAGAGDDCAVLRSNGRNEVTLFKTDCVVEGVHFPKDTPANLVGRKALARVISDIAAMGGQPQHAVITLILPSQTAVRYVEDLYEGLKAIAIEFGVSVVGGETSSGPLLIVSVSLLGRAPSKAWISRSGAKSGDKIFVTGKLGGSIKGHHLHFIPRVVPAQWLVSNFKIHSMMDISDGLGKDLPRMAKASKLDFKVKEADLPANDGCTKLQAWGDGEDYELLFALPARASARLSKAWSNQFPELPLTCIGKFVPQGEGDSPDTRASGWDHF